MFVGLILYLLLNKYYIVISTNRVEFIEFHMIMLMNY